MPETLGPTDVTRTGDRSGRSSDDLEATVQVGAGHGTRASPTPTRLGRYIVVEQIGQGGMGRVFRAYDPKLRREVALKVLRAGARDSEGAARITREAQAMAQLSHPNLVPVYDVEQDAESVFIAMEYVEGETLAQWLTAAQRSWREVVAAFVAAGRGLAAAHAAGIVHRDFKPANVMVGAAARGAHAADRVRVMDFGVARGVTEASMDEPAEVPRVDTTLSELTEAGTVIGTPPYMAPEQHAGATAVPASDQYAFCVALHEALFGERPFVGADLQQLVAAKREGVGEPPPRADDLPSWLYRTVVRGLAVDPDDRWPAMDGLLAALERGQARSHRRLVLTGITVVGLAGGGIALAHQLDVRSRIAACEEAGASIAGLLDEDARTRLRASMIATGSSYAETVVEKVMPWLDAQASAWQRARTDACLDEDVRGVWSADTLDRSLWCLDERRMELEALVEELQRGDATVVNKAVSAAAGLARVEPCRDAALLERLPAPPPEQRAEIRAVLEDLSRADALGSAGAYAEGLALARATRTRADGLGWPPLRAAVRAREAKLLEQVGAFDEAEVIGAEAYFEAARVGAWDVAAIAASNMIFLVGDRRARHRDALAWGRHAEVALAHAGDRDGFRESVRVGNLAIVYLEAGEYARARELQERALAIQEEALGADHPFLASSLGNLAHIHDSIGEPAQALALQQRAVDILEAALGPEHPQVASALNNLANLQHDAGRYEDARLLYERSLAIEIRAFGPDHPDVGGRLINLAAVHRATGDLVQARELSERALAILENSVGPEHPNVAACLNNLALVHVATREHERAQELYERSLRIREKALGPEHPGVAKALLNLSVVHVATGNRRLAKALLERAVAIFDRHDGLQEGEPDARFDLAELLVAMDGDPSRARTLAEQARDGWRAAGPGRAQELAEVERWLAARDSP